MTPSSYGPLLVLTLPLLCSRVPFIPVVIAYSRLRVSEIPVYSPGITVIFCRADWGGVLQYAGMDTLHTSWSVKFYF